MTRDRNPLFYRISQIVSLLLGARIFMLILLSFSLYVSTFFLFNVEESLRQFVFDIKVHGIIFCSILSIAAGGLINQFYDLEKDKFQKPFRSKLQGFLKQRYFLYSYITLNALSLGIALFLSIRIFIFFLVYQFFMWIYSHKLSKVPLFNNLTFVALTLYPFFGLLVYYQHFSWLLFLMALYLFLILLIADIVKDFLTIRVDAIFGYETLPTKLGIKRTSILVSILLMLNSAVSLLVVDFESHNSILTIYFALSSLLLISMLWLVFYFRFHRMHWLLNLLRFWIFAGVIFMLINGIYERLN